MVLRRLKFLWMLFLLPLICPAQQPIAVGDDVFNEHLIERTEPVFPPIAKAVRIVGTVVVEVQVDVHGKVSSTQVVSGPPMFQQAALDSVKNWKFKPFVKNGAPFRALGRASIVFSLGKDDPSIEEDALANRYFPASHECLEKSQTGADWEQAAQACLRAAQIAEKFPADQRFIEKRNAYVYAGWALMMSGDLEQARRYANLAVEVVKLGHDDNSGNNAAYSVMGAVEGKMGEYSAADQDLATAEDFGRKAIEWAKQVKFEHLDSYTAALVLDLRIHAQVLQAMGRPDEAQKMIDEASNSN